MFYWILWALLVSLWDIAYKKSVLVSENKVSDLWFQFVSWGLSLCLITLIFFGAILFDFQSLNNIFTIKTFIIFILIGFINVFVSSMFAYAFKNEKIAILAPYQESETIFTVVFGFLFFSNVSLSSFIFVLIAWFILVLWSLDFKNIKFNKYALAVILWSLVYAIKSNLIAYLLFSITPLDSLFYWNIFAFLTIFSIILFKKEFRKSLWWTDKKMVFFMNSESITRLSVWYIYAYLVSEIWIIQTTLLWLLTIFSNMTFAYIVFKEVPAKKDYIVAFLVILCIVWGTSLW